MSTKERALEIYNQHLHLATTEGRNFRKTVMDQLMAEFGCSLAASATHYNNCKKAIPVEGLGRVPSPSSARKTPASTGKPAGIVPDDECYTVIELVEEHGSINVGRHQSFLMQGDASETFDSKSEAWPRSTWVLIQGLGPNSGDVYKLEPREKEIKRYVPVDKVPA